AWYTRSPGLDAEWLWSQPSTSRSLPGASRSLGIGAGLHPRRGGQFADLARDVEVAFGHGLCVVAGHLDVDVMEGQVDIEMVTGLSGGGADLVDQVESGGEIAGEQSGADGIRPALPVAQSLGIECVEQILSSVCSHDFMLGTGRSSVNPSRGAPVARLPTCPCAVWVRPVGRRAVGCRRASETRRSRPSADGQPSTTRFLRHPLSEGKVCARP